MELNTGDVILTGMKRQSFVSWAIKFGSKLRYGKRYNFSHAALVLNEQGDLAESLSKGVQRTHISHYPEGDFVHISMGPLSAEDRMQILAFANAVLDAKTRYGWVTIFGLAIYCLTGGKLCIQQAGTAICSGFVCDALTRAGYIWDRPPYAMMPADIAAHFKF